MELLEDVICVIHNILQRMSIVTSLPLNVNISQGEIKPVR